MPLAWYSNKVPLNKRVHHACLNCEKVLVAGRAQQQEATPEPTADPALPPGTITGLTLTSSGPGHLWVSWNQANPAATRSRLNWAPVDQPFPTWNSNQGGNHWHSGTEIDFSNLVAAGVTRKLWMHAICRDDPHSPRSGPWSERRNETCLGQPAKCPGGPGPTVVHGQRIDPGRTLQSPAGSVIRSKGPPELDRAGEHRRHRLPHPAGRRPATGTQPGR